MTNGPFKLSDGSTNTNLRSPQTKTFMRVGLLLIRFWRTLSGKKPQPSLFMKPGSSRWSNFLPLLFLTSKITMNMKTYLNCEAITTGSMFLNLPLIIRWFDGHSLILSTGPGFLYYSREKKSQAPRGSLKGMFGYNPDIGAKFNPVVGPKITRRSRLPQGRRVS